MIMNRIPIGSFNQEVDTIQWENGSNIAQQRKKPPSCLEKARGNELHLKDEKEPAKQTELTLFILEKVMLL